VTRILIVGLVGAACLLAPERLAHAGPVEQASARFGEGREAMKRGDYVAACVKFAESQQLDPSLGTLLNLSVCEEHQGHLLRARALLEQFLGTAESNDERRASAEQLVRSIDARVSRLVVQVEPNGPADIRLSVDGQVRGFDPGTPFALDPGKHEIELSATGHSNQRVSLDLALGEIRRLHIVLQALPVPTVTPILRSDVPLPQEAVRDTKQRSPAVFYVALGTGMAGALTIAASAVMITSERSTVRAHCDDKSCDETGLAAGQRGKTLVVINTVAWPVAIAGASLAAYWVLFRNQHSQQKYAVGLTATAGQPSLFFEGNL